jgi:hypothetical protein
MGAANEVKTTIDMLRSGEEMIGPFAAVACASGVLLAVARGPHAPDDTPPFEGLEHVVEVADYLLELAERAYERGES